MASMQIALARSGHHHGHRYRLAVALTACVALALGGCSTARAGGTSPHKLSIVAGAYHPGMTPATRSYFDVAGMAINTKGDLFVADPARHVVEEIRPDGHYRVVAGILGKAGSPTPGRATRSRLGGPVRLALDRHGDLFILDAHVYGYLSTAGSWVNAYGNDVVEKVTPAGQLSIVTGTVGREGPPRPGPATSSPLYHPQAVAVDRSGDVYITDWLAAGAVVEKVTPAGQLSIVAGRPEKSAAPRPGRATRSPLGELAGLAVGSNGDLYIADFSNAVVEKVTPAGQLSIAAGDVGKIHPLPPGVAHHPALGQPGALAIGPKGDLYVFVPTPGFTALQGAVEKVSASGRLLVVAGVAANSGTPTRGPARASMLSEPTAVAVDPQGGLYIVDQKQSLLERLTPSGHLSVTAGIPGQPGTPQLGVSTSSLRDVSGVAVGQDGVYLSDEADGLVALVLPGGALNAALARPKSHQPPAPSRPTGVATDSEGNLYIADQARAVVDEYTPSGKLSVLAGIPNKPGRPRTGASTSSHLLGPTAVATGKNGTVFIADKHVVEKVDRRHHLTIVAGRPARAGRPTPGTATHSLLGQIDGIAVDGQGDVFLADKTNAVIEEISGGRLSIVAGVVGRSGPPTPGPASRSHLTSPVGVAVDAHHNLFIADEYANLIEKVHL